MNIKMFIYILWPTTLLFSIMWTLIFKKSIFNKKMFFNLKAVEFLEKNRLSISKNFFKKMFLINAGKYCILAVPILVINYVFAMILIFVNLQLNKIFIYVSFFVNMIFPYLIMLSFNKWLKLEIHYKMHHIMPVVDRYEISFFKEETNDWKNSDFFKSLNETIIIEFKNSKPQLNQKFDLNTIKKMCFKNNIFNANKLNYFTFKDIENVYVNGNKISTYEELSILRLYLFEKLNNCKPYF